MTSSMTVNRGLRPWKSVLIACAALILSGGMYADQSSLQVELIFLRDGGFTPAEVHRSAGPFLLTVLNRTAANSVALQLVRQADNSVVIAPAATKALTQNHLLNLASGVHVMSDTAHPGWTPLTITIQ